MDDGWVIGGFVRVTLNVEAEGNGLSYLPLAVPGVHDVDLIGVVEGSVAAEGVVAKRVSEAPVQSAGGDGDAMGENGLGCRLDHGSINSSDVYIIISTCI